MFLLFYVDDCLMFSPSKYKIDEVYASLQAYFKIEDDEDLNKYLVIDPGRRLYISIHIMQLYLIQIILNMISGMDKSITKPNPAVKTPLAKKWSISSRKNESNYIS